MGIYSISCLVDGRVYVGQSRRIRGRWKDHLSGLKKGVGPPRLQMAWDLLGSESFRFEVLEEVLNPNLLQEREQFHIDRLGAYGEMGFNTLSFAGSFKGYTPNMEARAKIGASSRSRWKDPDFRTHMVEALKKACPHKPKRGPCTDDVKQKIRLKLTGVTLSPEHRKNMSLSKKGKAPIAAIAAIIWKIIKKLNDSGSAIKDAPKQITENSKTLQQIEKPMEKISTQKPKVVEVIKAATNNGIHTIDELDKAIAQVDKEVKEVLTTSKSVSNALDNIINTNTSKPEPQKPVVNPLPLRMSNSPIFGILGRVIDDDFTCTSISFAKLYAIHCRLDPELVKKFGPKGLEDLKQLGVYIDYFFNDTIKGHLHKYLKANSKHYVNTSINTVEGLNATISRANRVGNQLDVLINGMITAIKPETLRAYFKKYGSVDDKKVPRIMGSKLTLSNYLNHYFTPQMLASIAPKYGNKTPEIVDDLVNSARLLDFGSSTILDAPILNKLDKVTITDSIDVTSINTRVAKLLKQLESSKEHLITEASKVFEEEIKKSGTENPDRLIGYVNKGLGEYIQDMFDAIKYFERDLAEISTWLLFVNKHMNRMISFYKASTVMYIEYVNTPG